MSNLLIILGLILLITPLVGKLITSRQQALLIEEYEDSLQESFTVNAPLPEPGETEVPAAAEPAEKPAAQVTEKKAEKPKITVPVLGRIRIAKIRLDLPILQGVDRKALRLGIGYMSGSGPLGGIGNAVLAGHRNYPFGKMFNRLNELKRGDKIVVEADNRVYTYVVYEKLVVEPNDVSVIKKMGHKKIITLITCTPPGKDTQRLIVHGALD